MTRSPAADAKVGSAWAAEEQVGFIQSTKEMKSYMQKWRYGYLYELEVVRVGESFPRHFIVAESQGSRLLDQSSLLTSLDALGSEGWIISQNERLAAKMLSDDSWLVEYIRPKIRSFTHINFTGQYFMRGPCDF